MDVGIQSSEQQLLKNFFVSLKLISPDIANRCSRRAISKSSNITEALRAEGYAELADIKDLPGLENKHGPLIEGYRIERKLGEGGLGAVYKATQLSLSRPVAIKILLPQAVTNPRHVSRFMREAMASGKLAHPNIVRGLDFGQIGELYYIVMEFIDGQALDVIIGKSGPLSERAAMGIASQVTQALKHIWSNGYLHRDIKPENVLVTKQRVVKLCDLGLAKPSNEEGEITLKGTLVGTPQYMAPEQILGEEALDYRIDVYALGATLYYVVTGNPPFDAEEQVDILSSHVNSPPPPFSEKGISLSPQVEKFILKLLSKKKEDRCQSSDELVSEITEIRRFLSSRSKEPTIYAPIPRESLPKKSTSISFSLLVGVAIFFLIFGIFLGLLIATFISKMRGGG